MYQQSFLILAFLKIKKRFQYSRRFLLFFEEKKIKIDRAEFEIEMQLGRKEKKFNWEIFYKISFPAWILNLSNSKEIHLSKGKVSGFATFLIQLIDCYVFPPSNVILRASPQIITCYCTHVFARLQPLFGWIESIISQKSFWLNS